MITGILGRGRSGKSYEAVRFHICKAIENGRKVITNIPLNIQHFKNVYGDECEALIDVRKYNYADFGSNERPFSTPECYTDEWRNDKNQGPLYVIDEAHMSLKRGKTNERIKEFYTMHGHRGIDIVLLTQNIRQMDVDIANLIDICIKCTKNRALGSDNTYTRKVQDGYRGAVVNTDIRKYAPAFFKFYQSHTASKGAVDEASASDVKPIWKHWSFIGAAVLVPLGLVFVLSTSGDVLNPDLPESKEGESVLQEKAQPDTPKRRTPVTQVAAQEPQPVPQKDLKAAFDQLKSAQQPKQQTRRQVAPSINPNAYHPFSSVSLAITGNSQYTLNGREISDVYFSATRGRQHMFEIKLKDLYMAGYDVAVLGECLVRITYGNYSDHIVCDSKGPSTSDVLRDASPIPQGDGQDDIRDMPMELASN